MRKLLILLVLFCSPISAQIVIDSGAGDGANLGMALVCESVGADGECVYNAGPAGSDIDVLFDTNSSSSTVSNTASETDFSVSYTMPADTISANTQRIIIRAAGRISTTGTPNVRFRIKIGSGPTTIFDSKDIATANNSSNEGWSAYTEFKARSVGASGTMMRASGHAEVGAKNTGTGSSSTDTFTLDTTSTQQIVVSVDFDTADASNTAIMDSLWVALGDTTGGGSGGGGGGSGPHTILDGGTVHTDTASDTVSRGSLIVGNSTPAWDELTIGSSGTVLTSDGTDVSWQSPSTPTLDPTPWIDLPNDIFYDVLLCRPQNGGATTYFCGGYQVSTTSSSAGDASDTWFDGINFNTSSTLGNVAGILGSSAATFAEFQHNPVMTGAMQTGNAATTVRHWWGLTDGTSLGSTVVQASGSTTIEFVSIGGGSEMTNWQCCSGDGTNYACTDTGIAFTTSTPYVFQIDTTDLANVVCRIYQVDNGANASITRTANLPAGGSDARFDLIVTALANASRLINIGPMVHRSRVN